MPSVPQKPELQVCKQSGSTVPCPDEPEFQSRLAKVSGVGIANFVGYQIFENPGPSPEEVLANSRTAVGSAGTGRAGLVRWQEFELRDLAPFLQQGLEAMLVLHNRELVHGAPHLERFMFAGDRLLLLPPPTNHAQPQEKQSVLRGYQDQDPDALFGVPCFDASVWGRWWTRSWEPMLLGYLPHSLDRPATSMAASLVSRAADTLGRQKRAAGAATAGRSSLLESGAADGQPSDAEESAAAPDEGPDAESRARELRQASEQGLLSGDVVQAYSKSTVRYRMVFGR